MPSNPWSISISPISRLFFFHNNCFIWCPEAPSASDLPAYSQGSTSQSILTSSSVARTQQPSARPGTCRSHTHHFHSRLRFSALLYLTFPATAEVTSFGFPWSIICINFSESCCQFSSPFAGTASNVLILDGFP